MTITRYRELKTITSANEISERAQFYSKEYNNYSYRQFMEWIVLYDENFEIIEECRISHPSICKNLKRIVKTDKKKAVSLTPYTITDIGNGFSFVERNEYTEQAFMAMAKATKPNFR